MRQTLKRFAKLTAGYSPVTLLGPIFTIMLTPLYTRVLDPADYGAVDVSMTFFALIGAFVMLGVDQAINAHFYDGDAKHQADLITTAILFVLATGLVIGSVVSFTAIPIAQLLFKDPARNSIIYLLSINMVAGATYSIISVGLRLKMGVKYVNILGITYLLMTAASNILFVVILHFRATGIIATVTLTNVVSCAVGLLIARKTLGGHFTINILGPVLKTGLGLLPGGISIFLLMSADRLLLTQYVSQNDIGLYSIANKLGSMMYVLLNGAWSAWWPMALQMAEQRDAPRQYARMFNYFLSGTMVLSMGIGFFAPEILSIFTRTAYVPAAPFALALLIYFGPISAAISSFQIGFYLKKKTHWLSVLVFVSAAVNVALNLTLNPLIGVWGAVWATVIAGITLAVITYILTQRVFPIPYNLRHVSTLTITYGILIGIFLVLPGANTVLFKSLAILVLLVMIILTRLVTLGQIQHGFQFIRYRLTVISRKIYTK
jgi:O-antigen/teichoic acid export membrane protein